MTMKVAPREITDYVERACRVAGCDSNDAAVLADAVTWGEVHGGGAVAAFAALRDVVGLAEGLRGLDVVALDVVDARVIGADVAAVWHCGLSGDATLVRSALARWSRNGVAGTWSEDQRSVTLRSARPQQQSDVDRSTYRSALAFGVDLDEATWAALKAAAAPFLAPEAILDANIS